LLFDVSVLYVFVRQLKSIGPKLVPFFKTMTIYFVLFGDESRVESVLCCIVKCLPIVSLMFFVLLHGMSFSEYYSYSRKVLAGLMCSCVGDALMVWSSSGYFIPGVIAFAVAQVICCTALIIIINHAEIRVTLSH